MKPADNLDPGSDWASQAPVYEMQSSSQRASEYIRWLIWQGRLRPGDRVPQANVAGQLGLSNIPVREALIALEREGLITTYRNRGAFVAPWTRLGILDHYDLLALMRGLAVQRATQRATVAELEALGKMMSQFPRGLSIDAFAKAVKAFVDEVNELAKSISVTSALRNFVSVIPGNFFAEVEGARDVAGNYIPKIVDNMQRRKASVARTLTETMLGEMASLVVSTVEKRGLLVEADEKGK